MRLFRARRDSEPDRLLRDALERASAHRASAAGSPTDVQLLGQISGSGDWPQIREHWTRRSGMTGSWPTQLAPDELVLNLWPIPPGHLQLTSGVGLKAPKRQPRTVLSTPTLLTFDASSSTTNSQDALVRAIGSWVDDVLAHDEYPSGVRLAPPILEEWAAKGQLVRRRVLTFDLDWQLAPAEGVTWPPSASH
jgi:hypothetical protein